ncbi:hypothetical protein AB1Y20_011513 [Prymnesium parvum]|uniref:RING-type domain-containing protein n=1 Tax=Prymnesium parvum TaxID=97485 RepID=A0AB34IGR9_PRYPA
MEVSVDDVRFFLQQGLESAREIRHATERRRGLPHDALFPYRARFRELLQQVSVEEEIELQPRERAKEELQPRERAKEELQPRGRAKEELQPRGRANEELQPRGRAKEELQPRERANEELQPRGRAKEELQPRGRAKEELQPRERAKEELQPRGRAKEELQPRGRAKEELQPRERAKEELQPRGRAMEELQPRGRAKAKVQSRGGKKEKDARGREEGEATELQPAAEGARGGEVCGACTLLNPPGVLVCTVCDALLRGGARCPVCTAANEASRTLCAVCAAPLGAAAEEAEEAEARVRRYARAAQGAAAGELVTCGEELECMVCLEPRAGLVLLRHCAHHACRECLRRCIEANGYTDFRCPSPSCRRELLQSDLEALFDEQEREKLFAKQMDQAVSGARDIVRCPTADCSGLVSWAAADRVAGGAARWKCPCCAETSCLRCAAQPYHEGQSCGEHANSVAQHARTRENRLSEELMDREGYQKCVCGARVEKTRGCDNMCCRLCKYKWCWRCGAKDAACSCTARAHGFLDNATGAVLRRPPAIKRKRGQ